MIYDKTTHRWNLEISDTTSLGNIVDDYGSLAKAERELKKQARTVYLWIYNRIPVSNKDFVEYVLAKDTRFIPVLKEALISQLEYDLETGGNAVSKQTGIDFNSNGGIPRSRIKESQVSIEVEQILENGVSDFNLLFAGDYNVRFSDNKYVEGDY